MSMPMTMATMRRVWQRQRARDVCRVRAWLRWENDRVLLAVVARAVTPRIMTTNLRLLMFDSLLFYRTRIKRNETVETKQRNAVITNPSFK
jgi:hypothetical protein